jgi:hypothetical protein
MLKEILDRVFPPLTVSETLVTLVLFHTLGFCKDFIIHGIRIETQTYTINHMKSKFKLIRKKIYTVYLKILLYSLNTDSDFTIQIFFITFVIQYLIF